MCISFLFPFFQDMEAKKETEGQIPQHQNAIIRRYEKKIRKTHRVANLTEQNLKHQQSSLLHFKQELSRLTAKLQEMANKGDEHAVKRLKNVHVKLQQIEKIIPYIGKYIMVNRQAEIQTVAILKESCTVDIQRLKSKGDSLPPATLPRLSGISVSSTESCNSMSDTATLPKLSTRLETHLEEAENSSAPCTEPPTPRVGTAESSLEPEQTKKQAQLQTQASSNADSSPVCAVDSHSETLPSLSVMSPDSIHTSLLDQPQTNHPTQGESGPPYANLIAVKADVTQIQECMGVSAKPQEKIESPYATLASVRPAEANVKSQEVHYAEVKKSVSPTPPKSPSSNYAELDFTRMQRNSPNSRLNYVQVDFDPNKVVKKPLKEGSLSSQTRHTGATLDMNDSVDGGNSVLEKTLTPENAMEVTRTPPASPLKPSLTHASKSRISAMQDAIKLFEPSTSSTPIKGPSSTKPGPPPVKRKPKQQTLSSAYSLSVSSPSHSRRQSSNIDSSNATAELLESVSPSHSAPEPNTDSSDRTADAHSLTSGTMSVMERIKVMCVQINTYTYMYSSNI